MASEVSTLLQSILADSMTNISSKNPNTPSRHVRKEGWTEVFGNLTAKPNGQPTLPKSSEIQIIQYRMSWTIQLLLRIYSIPHQVINTPYLSNQSTGAYPQYRNLDSRTLIGNHDILPHLSQEYNLSSGLTLTQKSEAHCLASLLDQLDFVLKGLRYGDVYAWDNVYKQTCFRASVLHAPSSKRTSVYEYREHAKKMGNWNGFAWFQAWAERAVMLKDVKLGMERTTARFSNSGASISANEAAVSAYKRINNEFDLKQMTELARKGYKALDDKLLLGGGTLLGTDSLTLEDIRLFGHLAEALCDVNLVTILADMNHVIVFFQSVYQKYFGTEYLMDSIAEDKNKNASSNDDNFAWINANNRVNALNQFNRIPMNVQACMGGSGENRYKDAIEIMQTVALHCNDLQEVLKDMAQQREKEDALMARDSSGASSGSMLHNWLMGADLNIHTKRGVDKNDDSDEEDDDIMKKNRKHMKNMMREAKKNDEVWISGVVCATVVALLASSNTTN